MSLAMSVQSRGRARTVARTAAVVSRFGPTAGAMARRLERYAAITAAAGARPTWPATACVLARHPNVLREHAANGVELALHGLVHGDHAALDLGRQRDAMRRGLDLFARHGFTPIGFRGPYLRYNEATLAALRDVGLAYHSSQAVAFAPRAQGGAAADAYERALRLYSARDASRTCVIPRLRDGLVDIPVAVPDDEIVLERLALAPDERIAQWVDMFETTYARGELLTLQLHPERVDELGDALSATLAAARAKRPPVYVATLAEIAAWWRRRAAFRLTVGASPDGSVVTLDASAGAVLLARGGDAVGTPWGDGYVRADRPRIELRGPRTPKVGISPRTAPGVRELLIDEGFVGETSDDPTRYGAYLDIPSGTWSDAEVRAALEAAPGPLVRVWRWPSGARSALSVTGDIDALTLRDFVTRSWETRDYIPARGGLR